MVRRAAALAFVLALTPATLYAQDVVLTVNVPTANVHEGPSTGSPVVGQVSRGTVMPVMRNLGSWVKVPWTGAHDGVGYVHVTMGRLSPAKAEPARPNAAPRGSSAAAVAPPAASASGARQPAMVQQPRPAAPRERVVVGGQHGATAISHVLGFGGGVGTMDSFGASARNWRNDRFGFQVAVTRDAMTSAVAPGRVTAMQIEPAVVYRVYDFVSDYFWVRPYVGSGLAIRHQTLHASPESATNATDNGVGLRLFGGGEMTFAGAPRFALSVEVGYRHYPTPFPGFEPDRMSTLLAGHWYIK